MHISKLLFWPSSAADDSVVGVLIKVQVYTKKKKIMCVVVVFQIIRDVACIDDNSVK